MITKSSFTAAAFATLRLLKIYRFIAACYKADQDIISLLLERGADVNAARGSYHGTALQGAVEKGNQKLVELLLGHGADVNLPDGEFGGALQYAVKAGNLEMTRLLLERGADVTKFCDLKPHIGASLVCLALRFMKPGVVPLLLEHGAPLGNHPGEDTDTNSRDILSSALEVGEDMCRRLLELGADINQACDHGTVLHRAIELRKSAGFIQELLNAGADPNVLSRWNGTPLRVSSFIYLMLWTPPRT